VDESRASLEEMIQAQVVGRGITDIRVIDALRAVPRQKFFLPDQRDDAFADRAAPIGHGQTISQPYVVALMTLRLDVQPEHRVLEIGTGSGYQTAILSKLAREVFTIERVKPLLDESWERLMDLGIRNVHFHVGDGTLGWPNEQDLPFDRILIAAAAPVMPRELLLKQLVEGGIALLPVGPHSEQSLVSVRREGDNLIEQKIAPVRFVPLIGQEGWPDEQKKR
jgi:protein-L-isoaspartate(D-aspartate) O-methyltransferase